MARAIERLKLPAPVVDPVIVSSSGALLIGPKGERAIRKRLIPIARIVTPNIPEAEVLARIRIDSDAAIREAAIKIVKLGARAVVIKGGHRKDNRYATDLFYDAADFIELKSPRISGRRRARDRMRLLGGDRGASRARREPRGRGPRRETLRHRGAQAQFQIRQGPGAPRSLRAQLNLRSQKDDEKVELNTSTVQLHVSK